jgi:hypothetical protein
MQTGKFLNAGGSTAGTSGGDAGGFGASTLIDLAISFGVGYLTAKGEAKKNEELLRKMAELDVKQAEELKKRLEEVFTEVAKTQVIIDFINEEKIKELESETRKKRILPLIGLGFGVVLLGLIFYKLSRKNG